MTSMKYEDIKHHIVETSSNLNRIPVQAIGQLMSEEWRPLIAEGDDGTALPDMENPLRQGLSYEDIKDTVIGTTNRLDLVPGLALWYLIGGDLYGVTDRQFLVGVESNYITCVTHAYVPPLTELTLDQVDTYVQRAAPHNLYQHHACSVQVRGTPAFYFTYVWDSNDMDARLSIYILNEGACNDFLQIVIRLLLQDIKVAPYKEVEHWDSIHYVDAGDKVDDLTVSAGTRIQYGNGAAPSPTN